MRRSVLFACVLGIAMVVVPAFAGSPAGFPDDDDAFDNLSFNEDGFVANEGSGDFAASQPAFDVLEELNRLVKVSDAPPLDKNQKKLLKSLYGKEHKEASKAFKNRFRVSLDSASSRPGSAAMSSEVSRVNRELMDILLAALRVDQQAAIRRYESEQLRSSRLARFRARMIDAEVSLTTEQEPQIEALFDRESRLRTLIIIEAKGPTYRDQVLQLEAQTKQKIFDVLNETQRDTLTAFAAKSKPAS